LDKTFTRHLPWSIWLCILLVLSLLPGDKLPEIEFSLFRLDIFVHLIFYSILTFLMLIGFKIKKNEPFFKSIVLIVMTTVVIGFSIELLQGNFIANRYFSYADILANSIGTVLGLVIFIKFYAKNY